MTDIPLSDAERQLLLDLIYGQITTGRVSQSARPALIAVAKKLEGTDKQVIVRNHGL